MTQPDVKIVAGQLSELLAESQALRTDLRAKEQARRRETRALIGVMTILSIFVLLVLIVAWQNNTIAQQTADTNRRIADCTTSGGSCYLEGTKRTGGAIASIVRAQIALGECTRMFPNESGPQFDAKLRACVYQRIATDPGPGK